MTEPETDDRSAIDRRTLLKGVTAASLLGGVPIRATAAEGAGASEQSPTDSNRRAQGRPRFQYAAKFVCGRADGEQLAEGRYQTAINVHNPMPEDSTRFRWKVAPAFPEQPSDPFDFSRYIPLPPDGAFEIDCRQIAERTDSQGDLLTGFVVVQAISELDVVAVYTSEFEEERTLDVERVPPRRLRDGGGGGGGNRPDLIPVEVGRSGENVVVLVRNQGNAPAGPSQTAVDFGQYGTETADTPVLAPGQSTTLQFEIPRQPNCFDPDCDFVVTVDATDAVNESNEQNNTIRQTFLG